MSTKWKDVIGQQQVKERLREMVREKRVPHSIMLAGETGNGTLALAMAMASTLICQRAGSMNSDAGSGMGSMFGDDDMPTREPLTEACGECPQCKMLKELHHPDLHFTFPTIKKGSSSDRPQTSDDYMSEWYDLLNSEGPYITMDQWMDAMRGTTQQAIITAAESDVLTRKLALKSSQGGYKVTVIWMAERMKDEFANKILKTLEEPTEQTVFILVCEKPELLLETIRSRVQRIDVPPIAQEDLEEALKERRGLDDDTAKRLARVSGGNWLKAVEQLKPDSESKLFLDMFKMMMRNAYSRDVRKMKSWADTVGDAKFGREKQKRMLTYFMRMIREAFMSNFHISELSYMTADEEMFVKNFGRFVNEANVIELNALLELALRDISQNTNQRIVFFDTALRLTVLIQRK